jgi:hypothetical protein
MSKKIQYRAISFEQARPDALASVLGGAQKLAVAIDVAKTKMLAGSPERMAPSCAWSNGPAPSRPARLSSSSCRLHACYRDCSAPLMAATVAQALPL